MTCRRPRGKWDPVGRHDGRPMPYLCVEDYPGVIDRRTVRGTFGDGSPLVQWLLAYAPELAYETPAGLRAKQGALRRWRP